MEKNIITLKFKSIDPKLGMQIDYAGNGYRRCFFTDDSNTPRTLYVQNEDLAKLKENQVRNYHAVPAIEKELYINDSLIVTPV